MKNYLGGFAMTATDSDRLTACRMLLRMRATYLSLQNQKDELKKFLKATGITRRSLDTALKEVIDE